MICYKNYVFYTKYYIYLNLACLIRVRFFIKIQIRILESKNGFRVSLLKSKNGL